MKTRYAWLLALVLGMGASFGAVAANCSVNVVSIIGQAVVLNANCGNGTADISWFRNAGVPPGNTGELASNLTFAATNADILFTTPLLSGVNVYTATTTTGSGASALAATITGAQVLLTVAPTAGGTVSGNQGQIAGCTSVSVGSECLGSFNTGTAVTLTATASPGFFFGSWGGDCAGIGTGAGSPTGTCLIAMSAARTAIATFGSGTPPGAPGTPTAAVASTTSITVSGYSAAAAGTGGANSNYKATCTSNPPGVSSTVALGSGTPAPILVTGLTGGLNYTCTVVASNSAGDGPASSASNQVATTAATAPGAPGTPVATAGSESLSLSFSAPGSAGTVLGGAAATITGYNATCTGGAGGSGSAASSPITVSSLTNGQAYTCTVTATNSGGQTGPASLASNSATPLAGTAPSAPSSAVATVTGATTISVVAGVPASTGTNGGNPATITGYSATCAPTGSGSSATTTIPVTGATTGASTTCTVTATNSAGLTGDGLAAAPVTPTAPTAPGVPGVPVATAGNASLSLTFSAASAGTVAGGGAATITGYNATCLPSGSGSSATTTISVTGLTNGTAYTCTVTATNSAGLTGNPSGSSNSATPVAGPACSPPTGWSCQVSPLTFIPPTGSPGNLPYDINVLQTYKFTMAANIVHVHPINFNSTVYTGNGATITANMITFNNNNRDTVISATPGSMTGVGSSPYCRNISNSLGKTFSITFNNTSGKCPLSKNTQYYLNVKATSNNLLLDYLLSQSVQP